MDGLGTDPDLERMLSEVLEVASDCEPALLLQDLRKTRDADATINNFFEGRLSRHAAGAAGAGASAIAEPLLVDLEDSESPNYDIGLDAVTSGSASVSKSGPKYTESEAISTPQRKRNIFQRGELEGEDEEGTEDYSFSSDIIDLTDTRVSAAATATEKQTQQLMDSRADTFETDHDYPPAKLQASESDDPYSHLPKPPRRRTSQQKQRASTPEAPEENESQRTEIYEHEEEEEEATQPYDDDEEATQPTEDSLDTAGARDEDHGPPKPKSKRTKLTEEEKARQKEAKEAEKQRRKEEKELERETEKQRKAIERSTSRIKQPKEAIRDLTICIDPAIASSNLELAATHAEAGVEMKLERHPHVQKLIRWQRKTPVLHGPPRIEEEKDVLVLMSALDLLVMLKQSTLAVRMTELKASLAGNKITVIIEGLSSHFKKKDAEHNKEYAQKVRGETAAARPKARRTEGDVDVSSITRGIVEHALIWFQMDAEVFVRVTEDAPETAKLVFMFTKAVATAPQNQTFLDFNFCTASKKAATRVDAQSMKGLWDLWKVQLMQVKGVTESVAETIASAYPSPRALLKAFADKGPTALDGLAFVSDKQRRVSGTISRRLHTFYMSNDPNLIVD